jgi:hypothetical protein
MDINKALGIYSDLANNRAKESDIDALYKDLSEKSDGTEYKKFLDNCQNRTDKALAVDSVFAAMHRDPSIANLLYGWDVDTEVVRKSLDELSGNEVDVDVRKMSRGYFSTMRSGSRFEILE